MPGENSPSDSPTNCASQPSFEPPWGKDSSEGRKKSENSPVRNATWSFSPKRCVPHQRADRASSRSEPLREPSRESTKKRSPQDKPFFNTPKSAFFKSPADTNHVYRGSTGVLRPGKVNSAITDLSHSPKPRATTQSNCSLVAAARGNSRPARANASAIPLSLAAWAALQHRSSGSLKIHHTRTRFPATTTCLPTNADWSLRQASLSFGSEEGRKHRAQICGCGRAFAKTFKGRCSLGHGQKRIEGERCLSFGAELGKALENPLGVPRGEKQFSL